MVLLDSTDLIGLADIPQWNPHGADHCVPYKAFIPHLDWKTQIQTINLTTETHRITKQQKSDEEQSNSVNHWTNTFSIQIETQG